MIRLAARSPFVLHPSTAPAPVPRMLLLSDTSPENSGAARRGEAREVWCGIAGTARSAPRDVSTGRRARAGKPRLATGTGALSPASRTARLPRGGSEGRMAAGGGRVQPRACTRGSTRAARVWGPRHTASPPRSAPPSQPASLSAVSRGAALSSPRLTRFKPPKSRHRIGGGPKPARTRRGKRCEHQHQRCASRTRWRCCWSRRCCAAAMATRT